MSGPFKLKYKNSAFPFKTEEKPDIKLPKLKKQKGIHGGININPETLSVGGGFTKGRVSVGGGYTKFLHHPGGQFGAGVSLEFGGKNKK